MTTTSQSYILACRLQINGTGINELCFVDREMLLPDTFTYTSQSHGTTSWLDHCITTMSGQSVISHVSVIDNVVCSDHFPLCIEVICDVVPLYNSTMTSAVNSSTKWHAAKDSDKLQYMINSEELASKIIIHTLIHTALIIVTI